MNIRIMSIILILILSIIITGCVEKQTIDASTQIPLSNTKFKTIITEITFDKNYIDFGKNDGWYDLNGMRNHYYSIDMSMPNTEKTFSKVLVTSERMPRILVRGWGGINGVYFVDVENKFGFISDDNSPSSQKRVFLVTISYIPAEIIDSSGLEIYSVPSQILMFRTR